MAVIAWVSMIIAGSLGWALVQTHHVGIKPALTRADRPSREPDLDDVEDLHRLPMHTPSSHADPLHLRH
jgi:hypothetical protein